MRLRKFRRTRAATKLLSTVTLLALPSVSPAAIYIWNGGDSTFGTISTGDDWVGGSSPYSATSGTADLLFGSTNPHGFSPTMNGALAVNSLTFNTSALAYTLSTNGSGFTGILTIGAGGLTDNATNAETITGATAVATSSTAQSWNIVSGSFTDSTPLTLNANLTVSTTSASATAAFSGALSASTSQSLTRTGAGVLTLSGGGSIGSLNLQSGTSQMTAGTLALTTTANNPLAVTNGTFNITGGVINTSTPNSSFQSVLVDSGGSLLVTGTGSQLNANQTGGSIVLGNTGSNASLTVSNHGAASTVSTFVGSAGGSDSLTVNSAGQFTSSSLYIGALSGGIGTATVTGSGSLATVISQIALGGYFSAGGTGTLAINGGASVITAGVTFYTSASSLSINAGSLTTGGLSDIGSATGSISLVANPTGGSALNLNGSTGSYTFAGTISGAGSLLKTGGSTQIFSGTVNTSGQAIVNGGTLVLNTSDYFSNLEVGSASTTQISGGTLTLAAAFTPPFLVSGTGASANISSGAVVNAQSDFVPDIVIDAGGSITVSQTGSQLNGYSTVEVGNVSGTSSLTATTGGLVHSGYEMIAGGGVNGGSGVISVTAGGTASAAVIALGYLPGTTGTMNVSGGGSTVTATTELGLGGSTSLFGFGGIAILNVNNGGTVNAALTTLGSNSATLNISGGTVNTGGLNSNGSGNGTIMLTDPTGGFALNINGPVGINTYSGSISGTGSLNKSGGSTQILSGNINTSGNAIVTAGTLAFSSSGNNSIAALNVTGGAANVSTGTLKLTSTTTGLSVTGGTVTVNGGTLDATVSTGFNTNVINGPAGTSLIVTGSTSVLKGGADLAVGNGQTGTFNVSQGAVASAGEIDVPITGSGSISVTSGGIVTAGIADLDFYTGTTTGIATVSGTGSTLNASILYFGSAAPGMLAINAGGSVNVTGQTLFYSTATPINVSRGTFTCGSLYSTQSGYGLINLISDPASGAALTINGATGNNTYSGAISGPGSILKSGGSTQILSGSDTFTGAVQVTGGILEFASNNQFSSLIVSGGTAQISGTGNILVVPTLAIITGGTLDLTTDSADVSASSVSVITALAQKGFNNGLWTGTGLTSSFAAADTRHLTAVGVIQNNQGGTPIYTASHQFEGTTPSVSDVLAKYTYYGDTNLDGKVDATDYSRIDSAFVADRTNPTAVTGWFNGDFNYDGVINGSDYTLIDNAFNTQGAAISAELASPTAQIAGPSSVPEPSTALAIGIATLGLLRRRRGR